MQTMQNKMTAQVTQVTQLIARLSGSFEGIEAPRGQTLGRSGENKCSSVENIETQPPVNETLGTVITRMTSLPNDTRPMQSSSGILLSQGGLSDQWNISRLHMGSM